MSTRRIALTALGLLLLLAAGWLYFSRRQNDSAADGTSAASTQLHTQNSKPKTAASSGAAAAEQSTLADALNSPQSDIQADLRVVAEVLDAFRTNFPHEGNPVGNNAEITATLTGNNKLHLALIPPKHPAINASGELCDRWGTPFFFHAESGTRMEIRSAGPDKKMWNGDDVVFTP
jgi:LPXTG-motif cell wall-anchored protein